MRGTLALLLFVPWAAGAVGCNSKPNPFKPVPECKGPAVTPFTGTRQMVMSLLSIADTGEGFDLDGDGMIDNKLSLLGALANPQIADQFKTTHNVVIPIELFGYNGEAQSSCTKLAFYIGSFNKDRDSDGKDSNSFNGDCLDIDPNVKPGAMEVAGNRLDDDCDGNADEPKAGMKSTDTQDLDGDGVSLQQGDCDDRNDTPDHLALAKSRHPGAMDVCGDGIDQNCDGIPDNDPSCNPFAMNDVSMDVTAASLDAMMQPLIAFKDGSIKANVFSAGPDLFSIDVPIQGIDVALQLNGVHLQMTLADGGGKTSTMDGLLGGVLEAVTMAQIKNINAGGVIKPDQSLLDAVFVGPVGPILALDSDKNQHFLPDIDVDGDGLEAFYEANPPTGGASMKVDTCVDGDGTVVTSTPDVPCALAKDAKGNYRFVDGLSVALKFSAVPVKLSGQVVAK